MVSYLCSVAYSSPIVLVPLASVAISVESDLQENLPATLICKATGGRPAPQIEWSLPEGATYNAEMVMETLVIEHYYVKDDHKISRMMKRLN